MVLPTITRLFARQEIDAAGAVLREGGLLAFATETVWGLGADATNAVAARRVYEAKGRPSDNPLIVHVSSREDAWKLTKTPSPTVVALAEAFWPGPLTLVLPLHNSPGTSAVICSVVTAGLDTVGVRVPGCKQARELIRSAGVPVAAPSANLSGRPSPTCARHVLDDLQGRVDGILEGDFSSVGVESTVIDTTQSPMVVLRPGGVTIEQLHQVDPTIRMCDEKLERLNNSSVTPRAPGMKYCHYAPKAPVYMVDGDSLQDCQALIKSLRSSVSKVALLTSLSRDAVALSGADLIVICGHYDDAASVAHDLYSKLREFDEGHYLDEIDAIVCYGFPGHGLGEAVLNRLGKASRKAIDAKTQR